MTSCDDAHTYTCSKFTSRILQMFLILYTKVRSSFAEVGGVKYSLTFFRKIINRVEISAFHRVQGNV